MGLLRIIGAGGAPDGEIAYPDDGGLVTLEGANGAGKSQTLNAIAALAEGEGKIPLKHGRHSGEVSGFGASIRLGARTSRGGQLDVVGLTSRMDVAAIVDPGYVQRDAANRAVVKALVRMLGLPADVAVFGELAPGGAQEFGRIMPAGLDQAEDLVDLARKVKDGFDGAARQAKGEAERIEGEASALLATGRDLGPDLMAVPHDAEQLSAALELAVARQGALRERQRAHEALQAAAAEARAAVGDDGGPRHEEMLAAQRAVYEAESAESQARRVVDGHAAQVAELRAQLAAAEAEHQRAVDARERAADGVVAARCHLSDLEDAAEGWQAAVRAVQALEGAAPPPGPEERAEASQAVADARAAVERGALVRDALSKRARGEARRKDAALVREREAALRDAGRGTDAVLSRLINEAGMEQFSVLDGEVMARLPDGRVAPYLDLSDGERTKLALDAMIPVALRGVPDGELAVIVLGQRVYQDLDYSNREALREHVAGRRVLLFTALPTAGPMQAVVAGASSGEVC